MLFHYVSLLSVAIEENSRDSNLLTPTVKVAPSRSLTFLDIISPSAYRGTKSNFQKCNRMLALILRRKLPPETRRLFPPLSHVCSRSPPRLAATYRLGPQPRYVVSHHGPRRVIVVQNSSKQRMPPPPPPPKGRRFPPYFYFLGFISIGGTAYYFASFEETPYTGRKRPMLVSRATELQVRMSCLIFVDPHFVPLHSISPSCFRATSPSCLDPPPNLPLSPFQIGEASNKALLRQFQGRILPPDHRTVRLLQKVGKKLAREGGADAQNLHWEFHVIAEGTSFHVCT